MTTPVSTRIFVPAMDCPDEEREIRAALSRVQGVVSVTAHLFSRQIEVVHHDALDEIVAALDAIGLPGRPLDADFGAADLPDETKGPTRTFLLSGVIALAGGAAMLAPTPGYLPHALFVAATAVGATPVLSKGLRELRNRSLGMNALMSISLCGASAMGEWEETAAVVVLFALANLLEARSLAKAREAVSSLFASTPSFAVVRVGDSDRTLPAEDVRVGDLLVVRAGERIPVDAVVRTGVSDVNEAVLTGESRPLPKGPGDELSAATVNGGGLLLAVASRPLSDSTYARIVRRVEEAQAKKAPIQSFMDRFAAWYTPSVLCAAALVAALPPLLAGGDPIEWIYRGLVLLVIACPCAIVLAAPVATVSATTAATRKGILVKGANFLEALGNIRAVAFDKTGTLTRGFLSVTRVDTSASCSLSADDVVRLAGVAESGSAHPVAKALRHEARRRGIPLSARNTQARTFAAVEGRGVRAVVDGRTVIVGSRSFLAEEKVALPDGADGIEGVVRIFVAADGTVVGTIDLADAERAESADIVAELASLGVSRVAMLTGDRREVAEEVARRLGIVEIHAGLLPDGKLEIVRRLVAEHGAVAMVGDGVNDAPALALSTVGVAMGAVGSPAAIESADVALLSDDLRRLTFAIRLGRRMVSVIRQNVASALLIKLAFVALAVAGHATLWMAVVADMGTTLIVVGNGMRPLRTR